MTSYFGSLSKIYRDSDSGRRWKTEGKGWDNPRRVANLPLFAFDDDSITFLGHHCLLNGHEAPFVGGDLSRGDGLAVLR